MAENDAGHKEGLAKMEVRLAEIEAKLAETKAELLKAGASTTKWLIGLLLGSTVTLITVTLITVTLVTVMLTIMFKILPILNSLG